MCTRKLKPIIINPLCKCQLVIQQCWHNRRSRSTDMRMLGHDERRIIFGKSSITNHFHGLTEIKVWIGNNIGCFCEGGNLSPMPKYNGALNKPQLKLGLERVGHKFCKQYFKKIFTTIPAIMWETIAFWHLPSAMRYDFSTVCPYNCPGWFGFKSISNKSSLGWVPQNIFNDKPTLAQVMTWDCQLPLPEPMLAQMYVVILHHKDIILNKLAMLAR